MMSDWSSFPGDKSRHDKWRAFLTESKAPQKIEEIEWFGAKKRREKAALETDRKLAKAADDVSWTMSMEDYARRQYKEFGKKHDTPKKMFNLAHRTILKDENGSWAKLARKSGIDIDELIEWFRWRFEKGFSDEEMQKIEKLRAERDVSPEEEVEAEEEDTPWIDRVRNMGTKAKDLGATAKDTMTKKRSFFGAKGKDKKDSPEEYPASGFASLYKTLDDINKRLKAVDRDALYGELEKLFKDQNFVVQESQIMIEAPGEIEGGALILGRNPQFDLESYPALMKLSQAASKNTQLAKALKSAFVGAGFKGVNISPATEKGPAKPEAAAEPEAAEPPVKTMPSGAEPPVRPMPSAAKSKAQKFEPSAETAVDQSGNTKIPATSVTTASKVGIGSGGQRDLKNRGKVAAKYAGDKTYEEVQLREHWQKLAGIIKG